LDQVDPSFVFFLTAIMSSVLTNVVLSGKFQIKLHLAHKFIINTKEKTFSTENSTENQAQIKITHVAYAIYIDLPDYVNICSYIRKILWSYSSFYFPWPIREQKKKIWVLLLQFQQDN